MKYAFRTLLNSPAFSLVAVVSIAVGIAGNAAIFSVADALLLRPLPGITAPDRLVDVGRTQNGRPSTPCRIRITGPPRSQHRVRGSGGVSPNGGSLRPDGRRIAQQAYGTEVSANYFDVAGVPMTLGRAFKPLMTGSSVHER